MPYLSSEETQLFKKEGYLLRNDLLSSDLIEAAQEAAWEVEVNRTDPATWFGGGPRVPVPGSHPAIRGTFVRQHHPSPLRADLPALRLALF